MCYNPISHNIEVVSRGNVAEKSTGERRQAPYPIFLGQDGTFIVLMLYENVIKVIPLIKTPNENMPYHLVSLTHAINVRVRHSEVTSVVPLYAETKNDMPVFGVLYYRIEHTQVGGRPVQHIKREFEKHFYDRAKGDLTSGTLRLEFSSNTTYRVDPLIFGGFLAFDIDMVSFVKGDLAQRGIFYKPMRSPLKVTALCEVDEFDENTWSTKTGSNFMRYLYATESGELHMLAFQLDLLKQVINHNAAT